MTVFFTVLFLERQIMMGVLLNFDLDLSVSSNQVAVDGETPKPWQGFDHRYSTGMTWHMAK